MGRKYRKLIKKANKAMDKGDYENAILIYRDAFSQKATAGDLFNLGRAYIYVGEIDEAIDCFKVLDVIIPEEVVAKEMLVGLYLTKENISKTIEYGLLAEKQNSQSYAVYRNLALAYERIGNDDKELEYYEKAWELEPNNYWLNLNLGSCFEKKNYDTKALELFSMAYKIDPKGYMVNYNLGVIYGKMGFFNIAKGYYLEELNHEQIVPNAYLNLALIYEDIDKDYEKAKNTYAKGLTKYPDFLDLWYNYACFNLLLGNLKEATDLFKYIVFKDYEYYEYMLQDQGIQDYLKTEYFQNLEKELGKV